MFMKKLFSATVIVLTLLGIPRLARADDATSFNPIPIAIQAQSPAEVPIGTMVAWGARTISLRLQPKGDIIFVTKPRTIKVPPGPYPTVIVADFLLPTAYCVST